MRIPDAVPFDSHREIIWVAIAAVAYILAILFRDHLLTSTLGLPPFVTTRYLRSSGLIPVLGQLMLRVPSLAILIVVIALSPYRLLRYALKPDRVPLLAVALVITLMLGLGLNVVGLWPFTWRWSTNSTQVYVGALLDGNQYLAVLIWALSVTVVTPLIEEVTFRFALLRLLLVASKSSRFAVVTSSLLFAVGHLGYWPPWRTDTAHAMNSLWMFALGILLSALVIRRSGNITVALVIHAGRNALETSVLLGTLAFT